MHSNKCHYCSLFISLVIFIEQVLTVKIFLINCHVSIERTDHISNFANISLFLKKQVAECLFHYLSRGVMK